MSATIDSALPPRFRAELLQEIRGYLPAFLQKDASERHDPVGDVKELLNLEDQDLKRVLSVHGCLDESILTFGEKLREGLRNPLTSSSRPAEVGQAVRGPVDWSATLARRSLEAGNSTRYVVRSARRDYDLPENRALVWLLESLRSACRRALDERPDPEALANGARDDWPDRIRRLAAQVERARATEWLRGIEPEPPAGRTLQRLRAARISFYRDDLAAAARKMMALDSPDERVLVEALSERYFEPAATWTIFEICVALRLAREFAKASDKPRRSRLLVGSASSPGRATFARYLLRDGSEVSLVYQAWPRNAGLSLLGEAGERHGMRIGPSKPDLFIVRDGEEPDVLLLELKASMSASYLKEGLAKLLGYLADRPGLWKRKPAGWLVAPASDAFIAGDVEEGQDLWVVDADKVAAAATERFAPKITKG
jgi:hypothetical protein